MIGADHLAIWPCWVHVFCWWRDPRNCPSHPDFSSHPNGWSCSSCAADTAKYLSVIEFSPITLFTTLQCTPAFASWRLVSLPLFLEVLYSINRFWMPSLTIFVNSTSYIMFWDIQQQIHCLCEQRKAVFLGEEASECIRTQTFTSISVKRKAP